MQGATKDITSLARGFLCLPQTQALLNAHPQSQTVLRSFLTSKNLSQSQIDHLLQTHWTPSIPVSRESIIRHATLRRFVFVASCLILGLSIASKYSMNNVLKRLNIIRDKLLPLAKSVSSQCTSLISKLDYRQKHLADYTASMSALAFSLSMISLPDSRALRVQVSGLLSDLSRFHNAPQRSAMVSDLETVKRDIQRLKTSLLPKVP